MILEIVLLITVVTGFALLFLFLKKNSNQRHSPQEMENLINQIFGVASQKIAEQSKQILAGEKEVIQVDLTNKQKMIENIVQQLQEELRAQQREIRTLEKDRTEKFGELVSSLDSHRRLTDELRISTQQLASVLSNNQLRGAWGERIIEDLLLANGLIEGVHYAKQTQLLSTTLRPDITLLLPDHRVVPVDVKFPYAEIQKMASADGKDAKEAHIKQFSVDLRNKIRKVAEYIDPAFNTLDYAILFVPNEMIFSFINQKFPDIVDEAIAKRVIIVSPSTFLIVARTVMESYRNFMLEDKLRDIVKSISEFVTEWGSFKDEFDKFGRSIDTLKTGFDKISQTRTRQMDKKIERIEEYRQGTLKLADKKNPPETVV